MVENPAGTSPDSFGGQQVCFTTTGPGDALDTHTCIDH